MKRIPLIISFFLFILLVVTASYWIMQLVKPEPRKIVAPQINKPVADVESVAGLFGGAMAIDTNYQLKGIVLANPMSQSVAIISVDGKPTQAFPMNSELRQGVTLNEVHADYILLLDNGISKRVDLPPDAKVTTQIAGIENSGSNGNANSTSVPAVVGDATNRENSVTNRNNRTRSAPTSVPNVPTSNVPIPNSPTPRSDDNG